MADVKWIKIVTDIFDDEKILLIENMPDGDSIIVIWFKLLCLAGKQNNSGVFTLNDKIPYTDEMLATIFRRNINTVRLALSTFEQFGMVEIVNSVITIPNWGKHQSTDMLQDRRDYMRSYMSEYRGKQKKLTGKLNSKANVNLQEEEIDIEKDNTSSQSNFDLFWTAYPKKVGKEAARKAFAKVKVSVDVLVSAIELQKRCEQWTKDSGQYIPNPATWLNQGRWDDEPFALPAEQPQEQKKPKQYRQEIVNGEVVMVEVADE